MPGERKDKAWFETWFDSPYYPVLYVHRDEAEAEEFIRLLFSRLGLTPGARVLDLGCGRGRHSIIMHNLGMRVWGLDLSPSRIEEARKSGGPNGPEFLIGDMRSFVLGEPVQMVCNLFTSFGYFSSMEENEKVLRNVNRNLADGGLLVVDFMNTSKVVRELVGEEIIERRGYKFCIRREHNGGFVRKYIQVKDGDKQYDFEECVQALFLEDFKSLLEASGFHLLFTFGDYSLGPYNKEDSPRIIVIAEKRK